MRKVPSMLEAWRWQVHTIEGEVRRLKTALGVRRRKGEVRVLQRRLLWARRALVVLLALRANGKAIARRRIAERTAETQRAVAGK